MKAVGVIAVLAALTLGALVFTGRLTVGASVTEKGSSDIQQLRNEAAERIRGK